MDFQADYWSCFEKCGNSSSVSLSSKTHVSGNVNLFTAQYVKKYWAQICGCSVNIVHPSVEVTKRPEQNSGWCGLWSATILDRLFHPWDAHHLILLKMMMIVLGISTNLVRIMWISGYSDLCVCACTCVCTTTLSLAVIWIVQNGSKFDPYRPPGFQQPSLLQHMLVHTA